MVFLAVNVVTILTKLSPVPLNLLTSLLKWILNCLQVDYSDIFIVIFFFLKIVHISKGHFENSRL